MEEAPNEACGIVICLENQYWLLQLRNEAEDPTQSFKLTAESIGSVIDEDTWTYFSSVWHTHPGGKIGPSDKDLETVLLGLRYMVMTLPGGELEHYGAMSIF
jgi:proteasome lid subunit RPN8/RPN11